MYSASRTSVNPTAVQEAPSSRSLPSRSTVGWVTVGELLDALRDWPREAPVVVEAHYPDGVVRADNVYLGSDQGPKDDLDELHISWTPKKPLAAVIEDWDELMRRPPTQLP